MVRNINQMEYNKTVIYDVMKKQIEETIVEPQLKKTALEAIHYKRKEFMFSQLLFIHYLIWQPQGKQVDLVKLMASLECFVLASDILDDLQDMDKEDAPWMQIEPKFALSLVPFFLLLSKQLIQSTSFFSEQKEELLQTLIVYELRSLEGQSEDLQNFLYTEEDYVQMTMKKSGSFVALACLLGVHSASKEEKRLIEEYALHLGCSAQLQNDLLGIQSSHSYKDVVNKKFTLPMIYLFRHKKEALPFIWDYYVGAIPKDELLLQLEQHQQAILNSGVFQYSLCMQLIHTQKALSIIDQLYTNSEHKEKIKNILFNNENT